MVLVCSRKSKTLENNDAIVKGPTPHGTGVICNTLSITRSIFTSQTALPSLCPYQISTNI
ncbi:hypothetical protein IJS64_04210 [bacterium]|nr:hypothetical protein [bacterium]MBR4568080.1 hypothetical protein [bacterium]